MAEELKEIRLKCMSSGVNMVSKQTKEPMGVMSSDVVGVLKTLKSLVSSTA